MFPNQNTLSGKGLGNLIALPLNQLSLEQGNSCFIDPVECKYLQWRDIF
ncbi:TOTE conflict system archaeo-eukaryotic primase domain-containing protein [Desertivirga arenae]